MPYSYRTHTSSHCFPTRWKRLGVRRHKNLVLAFKRPDRFEEPLRHCTGRMMTRLAHCTALGSLSSPPLRVPFVSHFWSRFPFQKFHCNRGKGRITNLLCGKKLVFFWNEGEGWMEKSSTQWASWHRIVCVFSAQGCFWPILEHHCIFSLERTNFYCSPDDLRWFLIQLKHKTSMIPVSALLKRHLFSKRHWYECLMPIWASWATVLKLAQIAQFFEKY